MTESPTIVRSVSGDRPKDGEVRVASLQYGVTTDVQANLEKALRMIDLAAAEKPDVVITVEFANHVSWYDNREQVHAAAIRLDGPWVKEIGAKAKEHGFWILLNGIARFDELTDHLFRIDNDSSDVPLRWCGSSSISLTR